MTMQRRPSEVLSALAFSLPPDTFISLLAKDVYPALDRLPDVPRSNIVSMLETLQKSHEEIARKIALINYDDKRENLQNQLKALNKHVKRDWHDDYELQAKMMEEIAAEVAAWLPDLWTVGVENGVEVMLVHNCLKLCIGTIDEVYRCASRAEFSDFDGDEPIIIKDASGREVYTERYRGLSPAIAWLWRELLLVALKNNTDDSQARSMIDDIDRLKVMKNVEAMLREGDETEALAGTSFHDEHWSEDMRVAASRLKNLLALRRVAAFESNPTYAVYRSLVSAAPALKESLLETTRKHFFEEGDDRVSWGNAVGIFKDARSSDDMVQVLETLHSTYLRSPTVAVAQRDAVSYLMVQSDEYRSKARLHLEDGLERARQSMWYALEDTFPGLDEAFDYLDEKLESKKLTKHETPSKGFDRKRDAILDKFIYTRPKQFRDCEEMREALSPDIAGAIQKWVAVLDEWPNTSEADEIRDKFSTGDDPLYTVDGIADILADRCDWDYSHSSAKVHVAEGIRAAYIAFGPGGAKKTT